MPRAIVDVPEDVRRAVDADLDNGASPTAVHEQHRIERWMCLRTFQEYATERHRGQRVERLAEQARFFRQVLDALGIERAGLSRMEEMQLGVALRGMLHGGKATAVLRAVEVANDIRRTQLSAEAGRMASERFAARKAERDARMLKTLEKQARAAGGTVTVADVAAALEALDREETLKR